MSPSVHNKHAGRFSLTFLIVYIYCTSTKTNDRSTIVFVLLQFIRFTVSLLLALCVFFSLHICVNANSCLSAFFDDKNVSLATNRECNVDFFWCLYIYFNLCNVSEYIGNISDIFVFILWISKTLNRRLVCL